MTPTEQTLIEALELCVSFIKDAHILEGQWHWQPIETAQAAMAAARQSEPPNFCSRCGKRLVAGDVHTCTPPMSRDAELEQARAEEREACAKVCEEAEIPFDIDVWMNSTKKEMTAATANALAAAIRARGQK